MSKRSEAARRARLRKSAERQRARQMGYETVSFKASTGTMAKIRAAAPLHTKQTIQAVLNDALEAYANQTERSSQDLAALAVAHWPTIRPILPYFSRLVSEASPPIRVHNRTYTYADVKPLAPILQKLIQMVRDQGHTDFVTYLDRLLGKR